MYKLITAIGTRAGSSLIVLIILHYFNNHNYITVISFSLLVFSLAQLVLHELIHLITFEFKSWYSHRYPNLNHPAPTIPLKRRIKWLQKAE